MVDDSAAIAGEQGAYVPCDDAAASEAFGSDTVAVDGDEAGYVEPGQGAAAEDADDDTAAVPGRERGYVATPCCPCGTLPGSSGLVDPGSAITGTHTVIQSSAPTLEDTFSRVIPFIYAPGAPGPTGEWYQWGVAETGQQWWAANTGGAQLPAPPDSVELDGDTVLQTGWHGGMTQSGLINRPSIGEYQFEHYDFGWKLVDTGFDVTVDVYFEQFGATIITISQFTMGVKVASSDPVNHGSALVAYRIRRSSDPTQLFMSRGADPPPATITLPTLVPGTWYRIRWQVDGPLCNSRVRMWPRDDAEPATWDGETTLLAPMSPNAYFSAGSLWTGGVGAAVPQILRMDNLVLAPLNLNNCHASVTEDDVVQIGPRQYQLRNSYLPSTIVAFVEHAGYPLVKYSTSQTVPNIVEDDPVAGIFSFPASIDHSPAYNPTIGLGTVVSACYIVPPA